MRTSKNMSSLQRFIVLHVYPENVKSVLFFLSSLSEHSLIHLSMCTCGFFPPIFCETVLITSAALSPQLHMCHAEDRVGLFLCAVKAWRGGADERGI